MTAEPSSQAVEPPRYPGPNNDYDDSLPFADEIDHGYFPMTSAGLDIIFPWFASPNYREGCANVQTLVVVNHGWVYRAKHYVSSAMLAAEEEGVLDRVAIVTPNFIADDDKNALHGGEPDNMLYWDDWCFWGHPGGRIKMPETELGISTFTVLDAMLVDAVAAGRFPNLKQVTIWGFSAGGQLVNRYAAFNRFEDQVAIPAGIRVRYMAAGSATYLYHSQHRVVPGQVDRFAALTEADLIDCPQAHNYGIGPDDLYPYQAAIGWDVAHQRYPYRNVIYIVGAGDNDPRHGGLTRTCAARRQGSTRVERALIYMNYLAWFYGERIREQQAVYLVSDADHSSRSNLMAPVNRRFMFFLDLPR